MGPCLEVLYTFLITEFSVDAKTGYLDVLEQKRAHWRRLQLGVAVRDAPGEAARVLGELGYTVSSPSNGPAADRLDNLGCY